MSRLCPYDSLYWFIFCLSDAFLPRRIMNTADSQSIPVLSRSGSLLLPRPLLGFFMSRRKGCVSADVVVSSSFSIFSFLKSLQIDNVICGKTCRPECWVNFLCGYWIKVSKCRYRVTVPRGNTLLKIACFCVWLEKPHRAWTVYGILFGRKRI